MRPEASKKKIALLVLLLLAFGWSGPMPANADTASYLKTRGLHRISGLSPLLARHTAGNNGKIVEWAGVLDGVSPTPDGLFAVLRTHSGDTFQVRMPSARVSTGKPVYVLARIVEKDGALHHLDGLAIAETQQVTTAKAAALKRAVSASQPIALRGEPVAGLSLNGAVQWILSFNRGMDAGTAQVLARTVLTSCASYGVDARLALSLFAAESAFHNDAVSSAGAQGLGQLMPGTAATLGVRNPFNPFENTDASIRHLSELMARWRGSPSQVELALAAYNAGAGAVEQYGGIPPYAETVNYVRTILGYYTELSRYP